MQVPSTYLYLVLSNYGILKWEELAWGTRQIKDIIWAYRCLYNIFLGTDHSAKSNRKNDT